MFLFSILFVDIAGIVVEVVVEVVVELEFQSLGNVVDIVENMLVIVFVVAIEIAVVDLVDTVVAVVVAVDTVDIVDFVVVVHMGIAEGKDTVEHIVDLYKHTHPTQIYENTHILNHLAIFVLHMLLQYYWH